MPIVHHKPGMTGRDCCHVHSPIVHHTIENTLPETSIATEDQLEELFMLTIREGNTWYAHNTIII